MIKLSLDTPGTIATIIIFGIIGYFVYDGSIDAAIAVMALSLVVGFVTLLSLIPIIGWIISVLLSYYWVIPAMLEITGIEQTWLITAIFVLNAILGFVITIFMSVVIIKIFMMRK